jgi:hypothetical protein
MPAFAGMTNFYFGSRPGFKPSPEREINDVILQSPCPRDLFNYAVVHDALVGEFDGLSQTLAQEIQTHLKLPLGKIRVRDREAVFVSCFGRR